MPTVSIAYSIKARGINRDIFGDEWMVIPTSQLTNNSLTTTFEEMVEREKELKERLNIAVPELQWKVVSAAREVLVHV